MNLPAPRRERPAFSPARFALWISVGAVLFGGAHLFDGVLHRTLSLSTADLAPVESRDWYRMLRVLGFWPTWVLIGAAVALGASPRRGTAWRVGGLAIALSAGVTGLLAEVLKVLIARERPGAHGEHVFRPLFSGFTNGSGLGLPSSHAAVAFGAAWAVWMIDRRAGLVALAAACGCAFTRVLSGAHFFSDVVGSALAAYAVARGVRALLKIPAGAGRAWV